MGRSDHSFYGRNRFGSKFWLFVALVALVAVFYLNSKKPARNVIEENQEYARQGLAKIARALEQWKTGDYDANGRADYPMKPLLQLERTTFINGQSIDILDHDLARADLRQENPKPYYGYFFTLFQRDDQWPQEGQVQDILLYATPARPGKTGACTFIAEIGGQAWYCNKDLGHLAKPRWPARKEFDSGIWVPVKNLW